jgi:hypothetical protein
MNRADQLSKRWVWGVALVMATAAFIWWLAVGAGWPHFASLVAAPLIAYGLFRFARVNGYGLALWLVGTMLVISFSGISHNGWYIRGLDVLCGFAMMVIMLISCVVFLVTAFDDQARRGRHCAACVMVVSSVFIPASCAATSVRNAQYLKSVAYTTETLLTLNRLSVEIEAIRARLGRLPEGEQELVTLRGAPMPTFYENYRINYVVIDGWCLQSVARDTIDEGRRLLRVQMDQLTRGEVNCLCQPDPALLDELLADAACAGRVRDVYLSGNVADERFGRLRELPQLSCIVLIMAENAGELLTRLQGMTTIEQVTLAHSTLDRRGLETLRSFPRLKSLSLPIGWDGEKDLEVISNHPAIETLVLSHTVVDSDLVAVLQSLPRLRSVTIEDPAAGETEIDPLLRAALPNCECKVVGTR